jgi:SPP1 gp7 family putative phage head morphogenesis protein
MFVDSVQSQAASDIGSRISGINDTTRDAISKIIQSGADPNDPATLGEMTTAIRQAGVFSEARAETIARTETGTAYNRAAVASFREYGVPKVEVIDGDGDPECIAANGQIWTLERAEAEPLQHPNCRRDFAPYYGDQEPTHATLPPLSSAQVMPSTPPTPVQTGSLESSVNAFERDIIAKAPKVEYGRVFDAEGNPLTEVKKGGTARITWRIQHGEWRDANLTHFHPDAPGRVTGRILSLSDGDVITAIDTRLASMRAFGIDGRWMELRNLGYEYGSLRFRTAFSNAWKAARRGQWWAQPIKDSALLAEASELWNAAYRQTLIDTVEKVGNGLLQIVEGQS